MLDKAVGMCIILFVKKLKREKKTTIDTVTVHAMICQNHQANEEDTLFRFRLEFSISNAQKIMNTARFDSFNSIHSIRFDSIHHYYNTLTVLYSGGIGRRVQE
jgi:hypothetical protein